MGAKIIVFLIITSVFQISAGRIRGKRILSNRWVLAANVGKISFTTMDTLSFFNHSHDPYGTQNPDNKSEMFFNMREKQFRVSFRLGSLDGKYKVNQKNSELHLVFYEPDPNKESSDRINKNWNKTSDNLYTIQLLSNDSLVLVRKK
jgi:hypothetical protein